jgi:hypothetical protein
LIVGSNAKSLSGGRLGGGSAGDAIPVLLLVDRNYGHHCQCVAFPDSNAAYWTTPFAVASGLTTIIVNGQYVDGRLGRIAVEPKPRPPERAQGVGEPDAGNEVFNDRRIRGCGRN